MNEHTFISNNQLPCIPRFVNEHLLIKLSHVMPTTQMNDRSLNCNSQPRLLKRMRGRGHPLPVLVLTARDTSRDVIAGLDAGADDYVVKPCDLGEVAARLRALIRRAAGQAAPLLVHGPVELDPAARRVRYAGRPVELSAREFDLLHELLLNAGRVLTRTQLEARLYPWGAEVESNALEVHIHHLRKKLAPGLIQTLRGVGYLIPREPEHG